MTAISDQLTFRRFDGAQAREDRATVEDIYLHSYVELIATGDPFRTGAEFMRRFDSYTSPRNVGFELVQARLDDVAVGQTWGWPLSSESAWWGGLTLDDQDADPASFTAEDGARTFGLSELMVRSEYTGQGIARKLHDELLGGRSEQRATLLVAPTNTRAYSTYLRWGWYKVGSLRPSWPDAPLFDVLIHDLNQRAAE
jgi:ribosomal protein S18 acetylase RimI-like enzyme